MRWSELRRLHPNQWLIIEAATAHTSGDRRQLDDVTVVETCTDATAAFRRYRDLHAEEPWRELYFVNTERTELEIVERPWTGVRWTNASRPPA
jgi:hypothetical protein